MMNRIDIAYGPFRIIVANVNGRPKGAAYLGKLQDFSAEGDTLEETAEKLRVQIHAYRAERDSRRKNGFPEPDEIEHAIAALSGQIGSDLHVALRAHLTSPGAETTVASLARLLHVTDSYILKMYADFGAALSRLLEFEGERGEPGLRVRRGLLSFCTASRQGDDILLSIRSMALVPLRSCFVEYAPAKASA